MDDYFGNTVCSPAPGTGPARGAPPGASYGSAPTAWAQLPYVAAPGAPSYAPAFPAPAAGPPTLVGRLGLGLAGVLVLAVVAAVAIPVLVLVRDRSVYERTTVTIPPSVAGVPQLAGSWTDRFQGVENQLPGPGEHRWGVYGVTTPSLVVGVTRWRMSARDREDFWRGAEQQHLVPLHQVEPGPLGGEMRCGDLPQGAAMCVFADPGAYGLVVVLRDATPEATARSVRAAVEHRS